MTVVMFSGAKKFAAALLELLNCKRVSRILSFFLKPRQIADFQLQEESYESLDKTSSGRG